MTTSGIYETSSKQLGTQCLLCPQVLVRVLLFAQLKDRIGASEISLSLPSGATGHQLIEALAQKDPKVEPLLKVSRLAVGQEYVSWDHPLREGDEAAVIPPVSGG